MTGAMLEVSFRYRHGCAMGQLAERYPQVTMAQWCNYTLEVVELHTKDEATAEAVLRDLAKLHGGGYKRLPGAPGAGMQFLRQRCDHDPASSIDGIIERAGCLYLPPVVYEGGWEHYRIIAFDEDSLRTAMDRLSKKGTLELTRKRKLDKGLVSRAFFVSTSQLVAGLTDKQAQALLAAVEDGYYRVPRKVRTEDIARRRKVPRTTFEEHMRKAESKIMLSVAPYVALAALEPQAKGKA